MIEQSQIHERVDDSAESGAIHVWSVPETDVVRPMGLHGVPRGALDKPEKKVVSFTAFRGGVDLPDLRVKWEIKVADDHSGLVREAALYAYSARGQSLRVFDFHGMLRTSQMNGDHRLGGEWPPLNYEKNWKARSSTRSINLFARFEAYLRYGRALHGQTLVERGLKRTS